LRRDVGLEEDGYFYAVFGGELGTRSSDDMARATRHNLDQRILESWHRHEAAEPDISTERLMAMVRDDTGAEPDRQVEALQRAGMLRRN